MVLVKILGAIDLAAAIAFLMFIFGMNVWTQYLLFCASLLLLKSFFIISGDILSVIDLVSSMILFLSIFFTLPMVFFWIPAFLLFAKAIVSFA